MPTTQRFIEDAIEGGYKYHNNELIWDEQMQMFYVTDGNGGFEVSNCHEILLDPKAWEAVGKARGWNNGKCDCLQNNCQDGHYPLGENQEGEIDWGSCPKCVVGQEHICDIYWKDKMNRLTPSLIDGETIEEYLISIEE